MMKVCYSEMDTPAGLSCRLEAAGWKLPVMQAMRLPGRTSFVQEPAP